MSAAPKPAAAPPPPFPIGLDAVLKQAVLLFAVFIALVPTIFMIMTAVKSDAEYTFDKIGFPDRLVFDHFDVVLFESPFFHWMLNSAILAGGSVLLSSAVSCLGAYAIDVREEGGRVVLTGRVRTAAEKDLAGLLARDAAGGSVDNRLSVGP